MKLVVLKSSLVYSWTYLVVQPIDSLIWPSPVSYQCTCGIVSQCCTIKWLTYTVSSRQYQYPDSTLNVSKKDIKPNTNKLIKSFWLSCFKKCITCILFSSNAYKQNSKFNSACSWNVGLWPGMNRINNTCIYLLVTVHWLCCKA